MASDSVAQEIERRVNSFAHLFAGLGDHKRTIKHDYVIDIKQLLGIEEFRAKWGCHYNAKYEAFVGDNTATKCAVLVLDHKFKRLLLQNFTNQPTIDPADVKVKFDSNRCSFFLTFKVFKPETDKQRFKRIEGLKRNLSDRVQRQVQLELQLKALEADIAWLCNKLQASQQSVANTNG